MPRGGARPGAGRPRKSQPADQQAAAELAAEGEDAGLLPESFSDPKDFLRALMNCQEADIRVRQQSAVALMPFEHRKLGEGTKKDDAAKKADAVAGGKFGARPPPGLKRVA